MATVSSVASARRVGCPGGVPVAASARRVAAAPLAVAVQMKIGPQEARLRLQAGTAVEASRTPV